MPFANNADGVIYNKDLFAEHGIEVPTTWDEMIAVADAFQAKGIPPFYITLKDAWTSLPAWNALASNLPPDDFWEKVDDDETSFEEDYDVVAERLEQLFDYGQDDKFSKGYDDGNRAFAAGEVPMYLQGIWAITAIRDNNPEFEIGTFALPMDSPDETELVSGVDVAFTMPKNPKHPEESIRFIEFMMRPDIVERYVTDQAAIPTLTGVLSDDPALEGLLPVLRGRAAGRASPTTRSRRRSRSSRSTRRSSSAATRTRYLVDARQRVGQVRRPSTRPGGPMSDGIDDTPRSPGRLIRGSSRRASGPRSDASACRPPSTGWRCRRSPCSSCCTRSR